MCVCVCFQVDAEGAGAVVMPYALADLGHGLYRLHVRLLFPREVTADTFCLRSGFDTINPETKHQLSNRGHTFFTHQRRYLFIPSFSPLNLQVQTGGPAGICGHGGCSRFRHLVHGKEEETIGYVFLCVPPLRVVSCYCIAVHCQWGLQSFLLCLQIYMATG